MSKCTANSLKVWIPTAPKYRSIPLAYLPAAYSEVCEITVQLERRLESLLNDRVSLSLSLSPGQLTISWNIFLPETRRYPFSARSRDFSRSIPSRLGVSIAFRVLSVTERERGYHDDIVIVNEWERRRFDRETRTNERGRVSLLAHVWSRHPVR